MLKISFKIMTAYEAVMDKVLLSQLRSHCFIEGDMREWLRDWEDGFFLKNGVVILAVDEVTQNFVGWLLLGVSPYQKQVFCNVYVLPEFRRNRVGTQLLAKVRRFCCDRFINVRPHDDISYAFFKENDISTDTLSAVG
jgi:GNAT superfamily N-acetyltransferase